MATDPEPKSFLSPSPAFLDESFLTSSIAKPIRVMCELQQVEDRFKAQGVKNTVLFFGSARARSPEDYKTELEAMEAKLAAASDEEKPKLEANVVRFRKLEWMTEYYIKIKDLAARVTEWSLARPTNPGAYVVCTGGGPGMMEAANMGATSVPGGRSAGLGIELPFEAGLNMSVTPELGLTYRYFFCRKLALVKNARALVVCPGGYGTMDELFEVLTLIQTGREDDRMPVVLVGEKFWKSVLNLEALAEFGTVSVRDVERLFITDSVDEAFDVIVRGIESIEADQENIMRTPHHRPAPVPIISPPGLSLDADEE